MSVRPSAVLAAAVLAVSAVMAPLAQSVRPGTSYTVIGADGRRPLPAFVVGDQEMVRLDDVAALFKVTVREDRAAKALTVTAETRTVVVSLDQGLASVGGRLVSLPAPPARDGNRWLVPVDFVGRALPLILGARLELRKSSHVIVAGDIRVPRVTIRLEQVGSATRVTMDVTPQATYAIAQDKNRLFVRFEADAVDATTTAAATGLVEQVTMVETASIALTLGANHGPYRATTVPVDAASSRIVIDVMPTGLVAPPPSPTQVPAQPAPDSGGAAAAPPPPFMPPAAPALRTIVIDPGHGGDENGARGPAGTLEKDVTLDVSRRLKAAIEGRMGIRVLLTREDDRLVPHDERASLANNNKADLFISIHANASPRREARGAEVFYLSLEGFSSEARRSAESPLGKTLPQASGGQRDVQLILWEMAQARHLAESAVFAGYVEEEFRRRIEMSPRPVQQAPFRVLVAANMPAVLVEMAFISNPEQETQLGSDAFKAQIVQALLEAVVRYRARLDGARLP